MNILAIGSSVIDLFLKIEHEEDHVKISESNATLTLGDKVPVDITQLTIGGNGANVSVGLSRFQVPTKFYTYLGNDIFSREIENVLKKEGVELIVERNPDTGRSSLSLIFAFADDRIIFSHHEYRQHNFEFSSDQPDFIYVTSIGKEWRSAYKSISDYVSTHKIPYAFAPGSHQMQERGEEFDVMLKNAYMLFVNFEEAHLILGATDGSSIEFLRSLQQKGPKIISITDGAKGAYSIDEAGIVRSISPIKVSGEKIEKTGAGDAYASGFLGAYANEKDISTSMKWGILNASYSMKKIGAQDGLLTKSEIEKYSEDHLDIKAEVVQ